jgi:neutral ceramidase
VLIVASHTFSAPHIMPAGRPFPGLESEVEQRKNADVQDGGRGAVKAAAGSTASDGVRPARWALAEASATSTSTATSTRPRASGWASTAPGPSDKTLSVIRIEDLQARRPIAMLANYAVQPSVMDQAIVSSGGKAITGDLAGAAMRRVESLYGEGLVSFFLIGAAGDQAPILKARPRCSRQGRPTDDRDIGDQGYLLVDLLGERLAQDIVRTSETMGLADRRWRQRQPAVRRS